MFNSPHCASCEDMCEKPSIYFKNTTKIHRSRDCGWCCCCGGQEQQAQNLSFVMFVKTLDGLVAIMGLGKDLIILGLYSASNTLTLSHRNHCNWEQKQMREIQSQSKKGGLANVKCDLRRYKQMHFFAIWMWIETQYLL